MTNRNLKFAAVMITATLASTAFAWVPKLDEKTAQLVIDSAYDRLEQPVSTLLTLDLGVKDGKFAAGQNVVSAFAGGDACVQNWLSAPADYAKNGSRPQTITVLGQADDVYLQAQQARAEFRNLAAKDVLKPREGSVADGHLWVYVNMTGLAAEKQRDAYDVALRGADGKLVTPFSRAFVNDWKQDVPSSDVSVTGQTTATTTTSTTGNTTTSTTTVNSKASATPAARWSGSMVYYFDAQKAGLDPNGTANLLLRTEANSSCAYQIAVDLSKFY